MSTTWEDDSPIRSVQFDRATHTMRVEFESGAVYDFADVPEHLCDELTHSTQRDEYFADNVRNEFSAMRVGDIDLAQLADERREDAILGAPLAEQVPVSTTDDRPIARATNGVSHHTWVVDVVEDDSTAVQIDGREITPLPRWLLPADVHEGDVLRVTHARTGSRSSVTIEVDRSATRLAVERSADQVRRAPPSGRGDIHLT
jgi:hypothetical protein